MHIQYLLCILFSCFLLQSKALSPMSEACLKNPHRVDGSIGVLIDETSRAGKEQKAAMEMAVLDFEHCSRLVLHYKDSHGNSAHSSSAAVSLADSFHLNAIIGTVTYREGAVLSEFRNISASSIPIISLSPTTSHQPSIELSSNYIQMSSQITFQMQGIAAIVGNFGWRRVISIQEQCNTYMADSVALLSESLWAVDASIDRHKVFPCISTLSDAGVFVEQELKILKSRNVKIFIVTQASLEFCLVLFEKATELGMMEKGYGWIVSEEMVDLLDSVDSSVVMKMEGVIGLKTDFNEHGEQFKDFKLRFRRKYSSLHPEEDSTPSVYALRAYDTIWTVINALQESNQSKNDSVALVSHVLSTHFEGLSGEISYEHSLLSSKKHYRIVNVFGKGYKEVAKWSLESGLSHDLNEISRIYWPGGEQIVPKGWSFGSVDEPLIIGVPANGAFDKFVNVRYVNGQTMVSGFSINVFEAAVKKLPYDLHYKFYPFYGSYDEMVVQVHNKSFDAAVGDTEIMAYRCKYGDFTQPYIDSGLVMVVTAKERFKFSIANIFTKKMWIQLGLIGIATGAVIWISEHSSGNEEFAIFPLSELPGSILWLAVTIISLSHEKKIKNSGSHLVIGAWIFIVFVVTSCFTAVLSTMMTVPRLQPSVPNIEYLLRSDATVGCNGNSFIVRYLIDVLHFKPDNIQKVNFINEYPEAFRTGSIKAAFFVAPHAKVFLAQHCKNYTTSGHTYKLGGFGFVFRKGSPLAGDISEAILKVTQNGELDELQNIMFGSSSSCSSSGGEATEDDMIFDSEPLSGLFNVLAGIIGAIFMISGIRLVKIHCGDSIYEYTQRIIIVRRLYSWVTLVLINQINVKHPPENDPNVSEIQLVAVAVAVADPLRANVA